MHVCNTTIRTLSERQIFSFDASISIYSADSFILSFGCSVVVSPHYPKGTLSSLANATLEIKAGEQGRCRAALVNVEEISFLDLF